MNLPSVSSGASGEVLLRRWIKIGAGLKIREMFKDKVGGLPYGAQVAERLCRFTPVHFERLVGNPDLVPVVSFTKLSNTVRKELDQRSVKELAEVWTRESR